MRATLTHSLFARWRLAATLARWKNKLIFEAQTNKRPALGSGCGSVGRAVASEHQSLNSVIGKVLIQSLAKF